MSKSKYIFLLVIIFLSADIFASKARLEALGQDSEIGSYYVNDTRSVFSNPAFLNVMKNYVATEWGKASPDADKPNAEGGFFKEIGYFTYGVYLGSDIRSNNSEKNTAGFMTQDNRIDMFFAGDAAIEWGIRAYYADGKDEQKLIQPVNRKHSSVGLALGIIRGPLELYTNIDLEDKADGAILDTDKWKGDLGLNLGGAYSFGEWSAFLDFSNTGFNYISNTVTTEQKFVKYLAGIGNVHEVDRTTRIFFNISYSRQELERKGATDSKQETSQIPLAVGFEVKARDWLVLRGSIKQTVMGDSENQSGQSVSVVDSAVVAAGATLSFGRLKIDGLIGTTGESRTGTTASSEGVFASDNLLTNVSVNYWF